MGQPPMVGTAGPCASGGNRHHSLNEGVMKAPQGEEVVRINSSRYRIALGLVVAVLVMAAGSVRAEDSGSTVVAKRMRRRHHRVTTTTTTVTEPAPVGRSIDDLSGEVTNLRQESVQTATEVKQIQQAIVVAPPATAGAAPKTIGEHVG